MYFRDIMPDKQMILYFCRKVLSELFLQNNQNNTDFTSAPIRHTLEEKRREVVMESIDKAELLFICGAAAYFLLFLAVR